MLLKNEDHSKMDVNFSRLHRNRNTVYSELQDDSELCEWDLDVVSTSGEFCSHPPLLSLFVKIYYASRLLTGEVVASILCCQLWCST